MTNLIIWRKPDMSGGTGRWPIGRGEAGGGLFHDPEDGDFHGVGGGGPCATILTV